MNRGLFAIGAPACLLGLSFAASPVSAALIPAVFNFTTGSNNNVADGNARIFSATSPQFGAFNVRVTGWSLEKVGTKTYVRDSKLFVYAGGLGVTSGDDGDGSNNRHTIDNDTRRDFVIFQFDRPVQLQSATFTTFAVNGGAKDSDATIKYGMTGTAWNVGLDLNDKLQSVLDAMFTTTYTSLSPPGANGATNTRAINPNQYGGNLWLVGADFTNADRIIDGFKLTNLAVIPEPATWAMMLTGFGFVGFAARTRLRKITFA